MSRTLILSGVVSAAVASIVSLGVNRTSAGFSRAWAWIRQRLHRDHISIGGGWYNSGDVSGTAQILCVVRVAPSRRVRRPRRPNPSGVERLTRSLLTMTKGTSTSSAVESLTPGEVRVHAPSDWTGNGGVAPDMRVCAYSSSLLVVAAPVTPVITDDKSYSVSIELVARLIYSVATLVRDGDLAGVFAKQMPRTVDWYVAIGRSVSVSPQGTIHWTDIEWAGGEIPRRAKSATPAAGFLAVEALRNSRRRLAPERVVEAVLNDWLHQSGYWDAESVTRHALASAKRPIQANPVEPGS